MTMKLKKGDTVLVIAGKDKGKSGEILKVFGEKDKVLVAGVNLAMVHKKPTSNTPGQRIKEEKPIHSSNVSYFEDEKPVKIGFANVEGKKIRVSRKSKNKIG